MNREKKKRGRKPKANPQRNRLMIRLNNEERELFQSLYERSGKPSYSDFIADCVLNKPLKIVEINKAMIDFTILLSGFCSQFMAIGVNYNQVLKHLKTSFPEKTALAMLYKLEKATIDFVVSNKKIEETIAKFRDKLFPS